MENLHIPQISRSTIQSRLDMGYQVDISSYLSTAWEIFKKEWLIFSLYSLIFLFSTVTIVGVLFIYPFTLGFFVGADRVAKGKKLSLSHMFEAFGHKLIDLILLTLIPIVIMIIPYIVVFALLDDMSHESSENFVLLLSILLFLLIIGLAILLSISLFFAPYLIYFGNYTVIEAMKTSFKLVKKNILMTLVYSILISLIAQTGILLCAVGVIISMGFAYVCYYPLMKDVLFNEKVSTKV